MDILIKGMEMPTSCSACPMLEGDRLDGLCHAASKWLDDDEHWTWYVYPEGDMDNSKPCNCPLTPVPPHGKCIDADALKAEGWELQMFRHDEYGCSIICRSLDSEDIPTIIPASEEVTEE